MKILIIPDVHGRDFWHKPCKDMSQWDKVIFLGDYLDPYLGESTEEIAIDEFKNIVALKEVYKDKVILLYGNHDLPYFCEEYRKTTSYWCRHDYMNHDEIESIFIQHNSLFQWAWQYDKFLFTHAGVNNGFAKLLGEQYGGLSDGVINNFFNKEQNQMLLAMVSWYRGGVDDFSSPLWADIHEHYGVTPNKYIKDFFQIFGHTYSKQRIITNNWAMLDFGKDATYLEDGVLKDMDGKELEITKL